jgi:acyl-CoA reductase-like NAD-dependent aldehyde dehydrogenase
MRGAVTILLGGNSYVLKPAPTTVGCAHALADLWSKAGLPAGTFTVLTTMADMLSRRGEAAGGPDHRRDGRSSTGSRTTPRAASPPSTTCSPRVGTPAAPSGGHTSVLNTRALEDS